LPDERLWPAAEHVKKMCGSRCRPGADAPWTAVTVQPPPLREGPGGHIHPTLSWP
jgi:hypothetical protein